jgi:hypothetical protein
MIGSDGRGQWTPQSAEVSGLLDVVQLEIGDNKDFAIALTAP